MGVWSVTTSTTPANPAACAASFAAATQSGSCAADVNLACDYDEGRCACTCLGTTVSWSCRRRDSVMSQPNGTCPAERPRAGDRCPQPDQICYYDQVCGSAPLSFGPPIRCSQGYWETTVDTAAACTALNCPGWHGH